jgi:hypothetical protein
MELTIEELDEVQEKKTITYDDILAQMNMQIVNGRLQYLANRRPQHDAPRKSPNTDQMYNKYFAKQVETPAPAVPKALIFKSKEEYRRHMIKKVVEARIARAKSGRSTKLFFYAPFHYSGAQTNNNQLFGFKKKGITL